MSMACRRRYSARHLADPTGATGQARGTQGPHAPLLCAGAPSHDTTGLIEQIKNVKDYVRVLPAYEIGVRERQASAHGW